MPAPGRLGQGDRDDHRHDHGQRLDQGAEVAEADPDEGRPARSARSAGVPLGDLAFAAYIDVFFGEFINNGNYEPLFRREMGYNPDMDTLMRQRGNF